MLQVENRCIKFFEWTEDKNIRIKQVENAIKSSNIRCLYKGDDGWLKNCDLHEDQQNTVMSTGPKGGVLQMICQLDTLQVERKPGKQYIYHIGENAPDSDLKVLAAKIRISFADFSKDATRLERSEDLSQLFTYPNNSGSKVFNINDIDKAEVLGDFRRVNIEVLKNEKGDFIFEDYVNINLLDAKGNSLGVIHMDDKGKFKNFNVIVDTSKGLTILPLGTFADPEEDQDPSIHKFRVGPEVDAEVEITEE